jgi:alkyl hydroperoxide reductase subunit F
MLDANLTAALKTYLERLTEPVELVASLDDSRAVGQTRELLGEIAALSDRSR